MMPEPEATAKQFKLGTKLSELESQLGSWNPKDVEVYEWTKSNSTDQRGFEGPFVGDEGGQYHQMYAGSLAAWGMPASTRDRFTGRIVMFHHSWVVPDDLAPSFVIELKYVNGVLAKVDYGILPG
jgi:hypothetical protein